LNVVDSSAWLEYFADGPNASAFAAPVQETESLLIPTICLFEIFKRVRGQRDADAALEAVAIMQRGQVIDLTADLAVQAADLSFDLGIPMADSIILATARAFGATPWTQDADFEGMSQVEYRPHHDRRPRALLPAASAGTPRDRGVRHRRGGWTGSGASRGLDDRSVLRLHQLQALNVLEILNVERPERGVLDESGGRDRQVQLASSGASDRSVEIGRHGRFLRAKREGLVGGKERLLRG
jgi:predicted nucleic acid-binding protein